MEIAYPVTLGVVFVFLLLAVVPPRLPLVVRLGLQVGLGLVIYFGLHSAEFALPNGDELPMSSLFGGHGGVGGFNKYSMGFVCTILGVVASLAMALIGKLAGGKKED